MSMKCECMHDGDGNVYAFCGAHSAALRREEERIREEFCAREHVLRIQLTGLQQRYEYVMMLKAEELLGLQPLQITIKKEGA